MKSLNIPISRIGYGCYAMSGSYGANLNEDEKISIIQAAYDYGVKFFDTAGTYTGTEEVLGKAVHSFRDKISIATKVGLDEKQQPNLSKIAVIESCISSLQRLKTDYIDLFQVHYDDPHTPVDETLEALEFLQDDGYIRHYGIGHLPIDRSLEYLRFSDCSTVLAEMNPITMNRYQELSPYIDQFHFDIIAFSVTARGLLTGKIRQETKYSEKDLRRIDPLFKRAKFQSGLRIAEKLSEIGAKYSKSSSQIAIAWVLQNKGVLMALTGPTKINHLRENLEVMHWRIPEDEFSHLQGLLNEEAEQLKEIIRQEIDEILFNPLPEKPDKAIEDLIYVLENLIEGDILPSELGFPIFLEILNLKEDQKSPKRFEFIKEKIIAASMIHPKNSGKIH
jgi:aryl-alcohol dehydrogenase-like predicted oxidoreductase